MLFSKKPALKMELPLYGGGSIDVEFNSLATDGKRYAIEFVLTGRNKQGRPSAIQTGQIMLSNEMVELIKQLGTPIERTE